MMDFLFDRHREKEAKEILSLHIRYTFSHFRLMVVRVVLLVHKLLTLLEF